MRKSAGIQLDTICKCFGTTNLVLLENLVKNQI